MWFFFYLPIAHELIVQVGLLHLILVHRRNVLRITLRSANAKIQCLVMKKSSIHRKSFIGSVEPITSVAKRGIFTEKNWIILLILNNLVTPIHRFIILI